MFVIFLIGCGFVLIEPTIVRLAISVLIAQILSLLYSVTASYQFLKLNIYVDMHSKALDTMGSEQGEKIKL
jgi:hypothetical protein